MRSGGEESIRRIWVERTSRVLRQGSNASDAVPFVHRILRVLRSSAINIEWAAKITPRFIELTYEAALKSYWRKEALRKFLRASHIAESFLATWGPDDSKRDFLDKTFQKLQGSDRGKAVIFEMARNLSEQTTFPDLRNWEDSPQKIVDATKAVTELKAYLKAQEQEIQSEKEREEAKKEGARGTAENPAKFHRQV